MARTRWARRTATAAALLGLTALQAQAASLRVEYNVDATALKTAVAGTQISFELHGNSACSALLQSDTIDIADPSVLIETIKAVAAKGGPKPPKISRLEHVMTGVTVTDPMYVKVTGTGVIAVGGDCQPLGVIPGPAGPAGASGPHFSFLQPNGSGLETLSGSWMRIATFVYRGTSTDPAISDVLAMAYTNSVTTSYSVRVYDVSNSTVIAQSSPSSAGTSAAPSVVSLGPIANLPAGSAIFEVQMARSSGIGSVGIFSVQLYQ